MALSENLAVTLQNKSMATVRGTLQYDVSLFTPAEAGADRGGGGSVSVELAPGSQQVVMLRPKPGAAGASTMSS